MNYEVLNVDDDKMVLFIHEKMMMHSEFCKSPKSFESGHDTLNYIAEHKSKDKKFIIFLDVNMPELNGWEFMDKLDKMALNSFCHIFIVTSSIDNADKEKAESYPVSVGFVEKPLSIEKLKELKKIEILKDLFPSK